MLSDTMHDNVEYPTSDGRPMGETDVHRNLMFDLIHALELHFAAREDVYVTGNLLMFYEQGNPRKHVSPDVMVVFGVKKQMRDHYLLWLEGKTPGAVIEVTSKSTRREDQVTKKALYARLGVQEYFLFDPRQDYLRTRLTGYRLHDGEYVQAVGSPLVSEVLQLELHATDHVLRMFDPHGGVWLQTHAGALAQAEEARLQAQEARLQAQEARLQAQEARLQAQEARLQAEEARLQAEVARLQAESARTQDREAWAQDRRELEQLRDQLRRREDNG